MERVAREDCLNEQGQIIKKDEDCQQCEEYPCRELCLALQAVIDDIN